jgi:UDP-N-acetylglucosamine 2-epimerase (non-hydrolysing)
MKKIKIGLILGTRPEAIKMAAFLSPPEGFDVVVCNTGQHLELITPMLDFFGYKDIHTLTACVPGQSLAELSARMLPEITLWLQKTTPDLIFVQGDTQSSFIGALAAFYQKIPVAHIEAGLRTEDPYNPFPEEMNRRLISQIATYHFAPTEKAAQKLLAEGFQKHVWNVGNTGIDALYATAKKAIQPKHITIDPDKKIIFVTAHRRENHGAPMVNICTALRDIVRTHPDVQIIFPVHKNPRVQETVTQHLHGIPNISLIEPLDYPETVWILSKSYLILTDSGGLQEEAPALKKPVLVMRDETERTEGVISGAALLVGTNPKTITDVVKRLLEDTRQYTAMADADCPYGNGHTADQIWAILATQL